MKRLLMCVLLAAAWTYAHAQDEEDPPPPNPHAEEIQRLKDEVALLTQRTALLTAINGQMAAENTLQTTRNAGLTARWGEPPALPQGAIAGGEHLGGVAANLLTEAYTTAATSIAQAMPTQVGSINTVLVTSTADRRAAASSATALRLRLNRLAAQADRMACQFEGGEDCAEGLTAGITDILAPLGAIEKLLGLFRTDYTLSAASVQADELALRLAVAAKLAAEGKKVVVDGLFPGDAPPLLMSIEAFRDAVDRLEKVEIEDPKKADERKEFVTRARAFLMAGEAVGTDGSTPFQKVAAVDTSGTAADIVLFVKSSANSAVTMTAKSWFRMRNTVHVVLSGGIQYAYLNNNNTVLSTGSLRVGEKAAINLRELAKEDTNWNGLTTTTKPVSPQE